MKFLKFVLCILLIGSTHASLADTDATVKKYALIYNGPTTCEGCPEAIGYIARLAKIPVKYVTDPKKIPNLLNNAAIFIIGGTEDNIEPMRIAFNNDIVLAIQNYLQQGGRYLGVCGGAFIAAKKYAPDEETQMNGFNLIPADAVDYSETSQAHLEKINWYGHDEILYFQGGPKFLIDKSAKKIEIIAYYKDGSVAAFKYAYGNGKVAVVGPHPEADKTWLDEDHIDSLHWKSKQNLAVSLLQDLITD
jgi:glutamine amidotransferase-like uncharacterized protein